MKALLLKALFLYLFCALCLSSLQAQPRLGAMETHPASATELLRTDGPLTLSFDSLRLLTELSAANVPEAFPWLSPDGLRVYFTSVDSKGENIMIASRASLRDPFSSPKLLSQAIMASSFSACLSPDELEIYFLHREQGGAVSFWTSSRPSVADAFQTPAPVTLTGIGPGFIAGPSLSANLNELYLYYSQSSEPRIFRFTRSSSHQFDFSDTVKIPTGFTPVPGQLSKDNLKFLFGRLSGASSYLFEMSRPSVTAPFGAPSRIGGLVGAPLYSGQPSLSADGRTLVFAGSSNNTWLGSDLYLATTDTGAHVGVQPLFRQPAESWLAAPYPNPSSGSFEVSYHVPSAGQPALLLIFSPDGRLLRQQTVNPLAGTTRVAVAGLPKGICYLRLQTADGYTAARKLVVQ